MPQHSYGAIPWIGLTVLLPLLGFLVNGTLALVRPQAKRVVSLVGTGVLLASFIVSVLVVLQLRHETLIGPYTVTFWHWIVVDTLQIDFAFALDHLSAVMLLVVTGVGFLIHVFSVGYMREDPGYARFFAYLNLFIVFMLLLVLGSTVPLMFVGWEGVGLCSYLLIGFWYEEKANADAGKKRSSSTGSVTSACCWRCSFCGPPSTRSTLR